MLVNTCAVRDNAEQRVIGRVGELQRYKRPGDVLGVVGCMAQRLGPALLEQVPRVDLVVGPDAYRNLPELIGMAQAGQRVGDTEFRTWEHYEDVPPVRETGPTAFVTVQRGCDYRCTFCIVPYTRGPERSRKLEDVVREVGDLAGQGTTEVTLLGQTVNSLPRRRARLCRSAPRGRRRGRNPPAAVHQPVSHGFHRPGHRGHGDDAGGLRARPSAGAERFQRRASADAPALHPRASISRWWQSFARPFPASPSRPISSWASRARPRRSSRRRSAWSAEADFDDAYTFKYSVREGTPAVGWPGPRSRRDRVGAAGAAHRGGAAQTSAEERCPGRRGPRGAGGATGQAGRPHAGTHPGKSSGPARSPA